MERKPTTRKTTRKPSTTTTGNELRPAIAYIRVSTARQAKEGHSLEAQRERIEGYCKANGYQLLSVHTDAGVSGKRASNRPGLEAALKAVCRCGGVLVVAKLSRLARSTKDAIEICQRIEACGGDLASVGDKLDTTTPMGRFTFRLMASIDELERDNIAERTQEILSSCREQGRRVSSSIPYGYRLSDVGKQLIADPTEQAAIRRMRELRERGNGGKGMGYAAIARVLNGEMVKPRGKAWHAQGVSLILNRESEPVPAAAAA